MATHSGHEGVVKVSTNTVAEVTSFTINQTAAVIDDTQLSDAWTTNIPGIASWTASIECHWDETDTTGQVAMTIGSSVTLNLYPEGATTGDKYWYGTATINSLSISNAAGSTVKASFSATGSGIMTLGTAA